MIQITISAETIQELLVKTETEAAELRRFSGAPPITYSSTPKPDVAEITPPAATGAKRGPKPKVKPEPVQTDIEEVTSAPKQPTYDEVVDALKKYMAKDNGGIAAVRKLLMDNFSVEQTKAIKPDDYARVIELAAA